MTAEEAFLVAVYLTIFGLHIVRPRWGRGLYLPLLL